MLGGLLEPGQVGVHDAAVAVEREDQRDVDADALGDRRGDRRQSFLGGRDLDEQVRAVDPAPQLLRQLDRAVGVAGGARIDLDGHASVLAVGGVVHAAQDVAGALHVGGGELEDGVVDARARLLELGDLIGVLLTVGQGAGEDRGVRGDADDPGRLDQLGQSTGDDALAGEIVQPDGHSGVAEGLQTVVHAVSLACGGQWGASALSPGPTGPAGTGMEPDGLARSGSSDRLVRGDDDGIRGDAELLVERRVVGRGAEVLEAHGAAGVADDVAPAERHAGLDRDTGAHGRRDDGVAVGDVLLLEPLAARHGDDASLDAVGGQRLAGLDGELDLRAGGDEHDVGLTVRVEQHVCAAGHAIDRWRTRPTRAGRSARSGG